MYADWASVQNEIQSDTGHQSVLSRFNPTVGRDVATSIVHSLASAINKSTDNEPSTLLTDADVKWTMQIFCFGLTLPLTEHETINDCVNIYCDWFSCLHEPKKCVPLPIVEDPNTFVQDMLHHLYNVFVPRPETNMDLLNRQTAMCNKVLKTIQTFIIKSTKLDSQTWNCLLRFLLAINDTLLAPPAEKDSIGSHLCERVLSVLFELWILSCCCFFPSPSLWKTLKEMCGNWRHHEALVAQWHRVNVAFTARLLKITYGNNGRNLQFGDDEDRLIPSSITNECVVQCWFRFLHILGNPVELSRPQIIGNTQKFLHMALTSESVIEPHQHDCLKNLPNIFFRAMKSVAVISDSFLGLSHREPMEGEWVYSALSAARLSDQPSQLIAATTPPSHRRGRTSFLLPHTSKVPPREMIPRPSLSDSWQPAVAISASGSCPTEVASLSPFRPTVNSLLHLLGSWLLEASLVGVRVYGSKTKALYRCRTASLHVDSDPARLQSQIDHSLIDENQLLPDGYYEAGRAQACGTLCRIFCSHKTGEVILPIYTSRFYISLYYGLQVEPDSTIISAVLSSVIINSSDLLRVDLDGIQVILPQLLKALEELLPRFRYKHDSVDEDVDLRQASIHLLLSMLCLPLHFGNLQIRAILDDQRNGTAVTFLSLKQRITELLLKFLTSETDSVNTQMLLGGLVVTALDQAVFEETSNPKEESSVENLRGSAHSLFGEAAVLVCNRLMASWKSELGSALAAMEVLSTLARINLTNKNALMCKRTVNWICEFVVFQCSRPAPAHSKDLHSMIVTAFQCLTVWLLEHDYLLQDKECLQTVLQVVELGISGARSQPKASDPPKYKGDKELKPVSMRVRDAAEALLTAIIDYVGCFPPPCGPESLCTLLDEESLLKYSSLDSTGPSDSSVSAFQYFVLDGATIVGLLEQSVGKKENLPAVTAIVRGSFGRHAWTMQLRHHPRSATQPEKRAADQSVNGSCNHLEKPVAIVVDTTVVTSDPKTKINPQYFPDVVQQIQPVLADLSIPRLESTMTEHQEELNKLKSLVSDQVQFERTCFLNHQKKSKPLPCCTEPSICKSFQTARLFLSHYGFLTLEGLKTGSMSSMIPSLVKLDATSSDLLRDLKLLDALSVRTADTVNIFYVKTGQTKMNDILNNVMQKCNVQAHFLEFLLSLGWPIDVQEHSGWTGSVATSWKVKTRGHSEDKIFPGDTGGSLYDGRQQILYWADVSTEIAFIVPSPASQSLSSCTGDKSISQPDSSLSVEQHNPLKLKSMSLDLDTIQSTAGDSTDGAYASKFRKSGRTGMSGVGADIQVVVVWLENYEDHLTFPVGELQKLPSQQQQVADSKTATGHRTSLSPTQFSIIFIHALQNGLFRIHLQAQQQSRMSEAVPLVEGMVVSRRVLGHLVRQTAINIFRRRLLDSDAYQPPHVRRRVKIKDIVEKYRSKLTEPEFCTALFQSTVPT